MVIIAETIDEISNIITPVVPKIVNKVSCRVFVFGDAGPLSIQTDK